MAATPIPQSVIDKDHDLNARADRAGEALGKHRWRQTLDPNGPQFSFRAYARAIGRGEATVRATANGYALFVERGGKVTYDDARELAKQSAETQAFSEAIAEGSGKPIAHIARSDNRQRPAIVDQAKQRAERRGTDPVDEARNIATRHRQTNEMNKRHRAQAAEAHPLRFIKIEGNLARAKTLITAALREAEGVDFDTEEMELMRSSIANLKALLDLLDLRMAGTPDIDWDAEMASLGGAQ